MTKNYLLSDRRRRDTKKKRTKKMKHIWYLTNNAAISLHKSRIVSQSYVTRCRAYLRWRGDRNTNCFVYHGWRSKNVIKTEKKHNQPCTRIDWQTHLRVTHVGTCFRLRVNKKKRHTRLPCRRVHLVTHMTTVFVVARKHHQLSLEWWDASRFAEYQKEYSILWSPKSITGIHRLLATRASVYNILHKIEQQLVARPIENVRCEGTGELSKTPEYLRHANLT